MKYQLQMAIKSLARKKMRFSERRFAEDVGISRASLRYIMARDQNVTLKNIVKIAQYFGHQVHVLATSEQTNTALSSVAIAYMVMRDGVDSWKIHFMDFVDEFRRTQDPQLILLAPPKEFPKHLKALLASIVVQLCEESEMDPPAWASKEYFIDEPWFVSGMESLKAIALVESPLPYRRNNIFVMNNFLERV